MSRVTNIVITASLGENRSALESHLTGFLEGNGVPFRHSDECSAGPKHLESLVFIAALNYADQILMAEHLAKYKWEEPEAVRLFYQGENDDAFAPWPLKLSA